MIKSIRSKVWLICIWAAATSQLQAAQDSTESSNDYYDPYATLNQYTTQSPADTLTIASETQENEFQQDLNALFRSDLATYDTLFAWSTSKINSGCFEPKDWNDTARIPLIDCKLNKFYVHPFENYITSDFGQRGVMWHYGVDIKLQKGDTVRAAFDGVVRVREFDRRGYGLVVVLRHTNGLETIYAHLSKTNLVPHAMVKSGDVIGLGGNTGRSTGSHLHFEMRFYGQAFDPNCIIDFQNSTLKSDTLVLTKANFDYLIELSKTKWHTIRKGETLGHIAMKYRTSVKKLCALNKITGTTILRPGRKIIVYTAKRTDEKLTLQTKNPDLDS
jgi:murein DD-endopeptidase MepM/ murein hydrolase activator NlpD